jgi:hypothetical protein
MLFGRLGMSGRGGSGVDFPSAYTVFSYHAGMLVASIPVASIPVFAYLEGMEVHFAPDVEKKLNDLAARSGCGTADALVQDVIGGYIDELAQTREMPDGRYDDLKSGRVKPIDGEEFFECLRCREDDLLNKQ